MLKKRNNHLYLDLVSFTPTIYLFLFFILAGVSFLSPLFLGSSLIFEAVFVLGALVQFYKLNIKSLPILLISIIYIGFSFVYSIIFQKDNLFDFLLIFKSFVYIALLSMYVTKSSYTGFNIKIFYRILLVIFLLKYLYIMLLFGDRRLIRLYDESNFELMLIFLLYIHQNYQNKSVNKYETLLIVLITLVSGSRSGIFIMAFTVAGLYLRHVDIKKLLLLAIALPSLAFLIYIVFSTRSSSGGLENIDRVLFLSRFRSDTQSWGFGNFLVGAERISPMSDETCRILSYYKLLFSYQNDGSCYSVVLHSYILRAIYDHGIIGLSFILGSIYYMLKLSGYTSYISLLVIGVIFLNGFSVSSFNSIYAMIGIVFFLLIKPRNEK